MSSTDCFIAIGGIILALSLCLGTALVEEIKKRRRR